MWKKVITAISLVLINVLFLMACGGEGTETGKQDAEGIAGTGAAESSADTGTEVLGESEPEELTGELTILSWFPFNNWEYVIEGFTKEHPGVTVTVDMPG